MDSLKLIGELETKGILTKQAGHRLRLQRQGLIRNELVKEAGKLGRLLGDAKDIVGQAGRTHFRSPAPLSVHKMPGGRAPWGTAGANILKLMALAGMASAGSAAINAGIRHSRDKKLNGEIEHAYGQLVTENPDLAKRDPEMLRKHFEVLSRYAPSLAANPTVAASMIGESSFKGGMGGQAIKMMTDIQKSIDDIHSKHSVWGKSPLSDHMQTATRALGGD